MLLNLNAYAHKSIALGFSRNRAGTAIYLQSFGKMVAPAAWHKLSLFPPALADRHTNSKFGLAVAEVQDFLFGFHQTAAFTTKEPFSLSQ